MKYHLLIIRHPAICRHLPLELLDVRRAALETLEFIGSIPKFQETYTLGYIIIVLHLSIFFEIDQQETREN